MSSSPLDQPATRAHLEHLARTGHLSPAALERALHLAGHRPDPVTWRRFADRMLLLLGLALLLAGIIFFFAYNWAAMSRFVKFALIEAALAGAVGAAWFRGVHRLGGQAALTGAVVLVGAFLAVFGQVYPTGADAYELFGLWSLLILPWVTVSRFPALWVLWLALLDATWLAYRAQVTDPTGAAWPATVLPPAVLHLTALAAWETGAARGVAWLRKRWAPALLAAVALAALSASVVDAFFAARGFGLHLGGTHGLAVALYTAVLVTGLWFYRSRRDVLMLALWLLSAIVVVTAGLIKTIDVEGWGALFIGLLVVAQSAAAAAWLRTVAREGGS